MGIDEIISYIQKNLLAGKSEDLIKKELQSVGWPEKDINEALIKAKATKPKSPSLNIEITTPKHDRPNYLRENFKEFSNFSKIAETAKKKKLSIVPIIIIPAIIVIGILLRNWYLENNPPEISPSQENTPLDLIAGNETSTPNQIQATSTGQPATLTITQPKFGDRWEIGKTQIILWKTSNINPSNQTLIYLQQFSPENQNIPQKTTLLSPPNLTNTERFEFTVPKTFNSINLINPTGTTMLYKIKIQVNGSAGNIIIEKESGKFIIQEPKVQTPSTDDETTR